MGPRRPGASTLAWVALALVVMVALAAGARGGDGSATEGDRVSDLAASLRCPTCRGQSVLESDAPAADGIRNEIARRVEAGEGDDEIRAYLVSRYGESVLLTPPRSGVAGLVWVLPAAALVAALGGLALAFRRWRGAPGEGPSEEDRERVRRARRPAAAP